MLILKLFHNFKYSLFVLYFDFFYQKKPIEDFI